MTESMIKPEILSEDEIDRRVEKILLELQMVLAQNTPKAHPDNAYILLTSAIQLYTMVSKRFVNTKQNHLYNSALAWDNMRLEDLKEVTFQ